MVSIFRVVTTWTGFSGAPGYTNFFFRNVLPGGAPTEIDDRGSAIGAHERTHAFFNSIKGMLPNDVRLDVDPNVDELDDASGGIIGSFGVPSKPQLQGGAEGVFSSASGAVISWGTGTVRNRRRIRGRTFIVPLDGSIYTGNGRISGGAVQSLKTAGEALAIGGINSTFGVWARPIDPENLDPEKESMPGVWAEATSVRVTDLPAVLRSRRD